MGTEQFIPVDEQTAAMVRFAARVHGLTQSQVVAYAVTALGTDPNDKAIDLWQPVPVVGTYRGVTVTGEFVPGSKRTRITSAPCAGQVFKSPSGAASAVVAALNPGRSSAAHTNGWRFWRHADTAQRIETYRYGLRR